MPRKKNPTKKEMEEINEVVEVVNYSKEQLIEAKRKELPQYIENRKNEFLKELQEYNIIKEENDGEVQAGNKVIPMVALVENCFSPFIKVAGVTLNYSADEFAIVFEYFRKCIVEMNKTEIVPPTVDLFARLCGFSTQRFHELRREGAAEVREVLEQVNDWIVSFLNMAGLTRKVSEVMSIYNQKVLGRRDDAPQQTAQTINNITIGESEFARLLGQYDTKGK